MIYMNNTIKAVLTKMLGQKEIVDFYEVDKGQDFVELKGEDRCVLIDSTEEDGRVCNLVCHFEMELPKYDDVILASVFCNNLNNELQNTSARLEFQLKPSLEDDGVNSAVLWLVTTIPSVCLNECVFREMLLSHISALTNIESYILSFAAKAENGTLETSDAFPRELDYYIEFNPLLLRMLKEYAENREKGDEDNDGKSNSS